MIPIPNNKDLSDSINDKLEEGKSPFRLVPDKLGGIINIESKGHVFIKSLSKEVGKMDAFFWVFIKHLLEHFLKQEIEVSHNQNSFWYQIKGNLKPQSYEPIVNNNYNADCNGIIHRPKTKAEIEAPVSPPKKNAGTRQYKKCGCWSRHD